MNNRPLLVYIGHHKCATSWIDAIIEQYCEIMGWKFVQAHNPEIFKNKNPNHVVKEHNIDFLAYTSPDHSYVTALDNFIGFHVIRDPRDIVVSAYYSHLYSHQTQGWPELIRHRKALQKVSKDEGLFLEMEFRKEDFTALSAWNYTQENVLEIKMEDMIQNPYEIMVRIFEFLGVIDDMVYSLSAQIKFIFAHILNRIHSKTHGLFPFRKKLEKMPVEELLGIVFRQRFSVQTQGRKIGEEDRKSHYRKGIAGDWKNHFTSDHILYFKEQYNDLLLKLEYETTADW